MISKKIKGSYIVEIQKHLQEFGDNDLRHYGATIFAGKCGRLLAKLRGLEVVHEMDKIELFASDVGAYDKKSTEALLVELEKKGKVDIFRNGNQIIKVEERANTEDEILELTDEIWETSEPSEEDQASLEILKLCSQLPRVKSELQSSMESIGFGPVAELSMELSNKFSLTKKIENMPGFTEPIFHAPVLGNYNVKGIINSIRHLDYNLRSQLENILTTVGSHQAIPEEQLQTPQSLVNEIHNLGVIHFTEVETRQGIEKKFAFTPSMWGPFGTSLLPDEQEHVKAMLSCVQFGRIYPTEVNGIRFPIKYPSLYLNALIKRGQVGPSTPIGNDYIILEREGIVEIKPSSHGQYEMHLVKEDVALRAKRIIDQGQDVGLDETPKMESLCQTGDFHNTVQSRLEAEVKLKKKPGRSNYLRDEIIKVLRKEK